MRLIFDPPPRFLGSIEPGELPLPLMATKICAGFPSPADDFLDDELDLQQKLAPNRPATFLWEVSGRSMIDVGIFDGDTVVVDRSITPKPGDVVVAVVNGEVSLKLFQKGGRLAFANREMPLWPMHDDDDVVIWGVVTWNLHKPRG